MDVQSPVQSSSPSPSVPAAASAATCYDNATMTDQNPPPAAMTVHMLPTSIHPSVEKLAELSQQSSATGAPLAASHRLDWDGPDDPDNPWNWPQAKRWYGTVVPGALCLLVTFSSSVYAPGVYEISAKFDVSIATALLGLSMYVIGLGLGPMFSAPLSELFGRRLVYFINLPIFMLFTMGAALAKNIQTLVICRLFAGLFGGPALAVSAGSFVDVWELKTSGPAVSVQAIATFLGPALGPIAGGYLAQKLEWQWTMYLILIIAAALFVPLYFLSESYGPVILKRRAAVRGLPIPPSPPPKEALKLIFTVTLARPVSMLLREPIVQAISLYSAFVFAVLFGFFEAYPFAFQKEYGLSLGETGLCFIGIAVGLLLGCVVYLWQDKVIYMPALKQGRASPELRLVPAMIGGPMMPVGLFWFAWTARADVHWIVPALAGVPFGAGLVLVFLTSVMYMLEIYPALVAASAIAAMGLLRYVLAMAFPLFTVSMYKHMGINWATSLYGFFSAALLPIPFVLQKWGPQIRAMSKFDAMTEQH